MTGARGPGRRGASRAGLACSVVSGLSTGGLAGYFLPDAWDDLRSCTPGSRAGACTSHPFWGFSPELFVVACLVGVVVGVLTVGLGLLTYRGSVRPGLGGTALVVLGLAGLIAYGGLGVGTLAGVVGGVIFRRATAARVGSPNEWSGSIPPGVPPPPRSNRRAVPDRPSVTEWDGIVASAPSGPPGGARQRVALPTADRLAAALEKSRTPGSPSSAAPPVVVLPPPPQGLRSVRSAPPVITTQASAPPPTRPRPSAASVETAGTVEPARGRRWQPSSGELRPWEPPSGAPVPPERGASVSARPVPHPPPPASASPSATPAPAAHRAPAPAPAATVASGGSTGVPGPLRQPLHRPATAPVASPPGSPWPSVPAPAAARAPAPTAPPSPVPSAPGRPPPPKPVPTPAPATVAPSPEVGDRPPPPSGPAPKARNRAWRCPSCGLVNAPWSHRCTKCKSEAPQFP